MATRSKRRKKRRPFPDLFQQAQRSFERGDFKQALKDARVCYRQEGSDEHRRFLERASLARARELHRSGLRDECRTLLKTLLEMGVTEPSVEQELPPLLVAAGLFDRGTVGREQAAVEADPALLASAADHAVLRPEEAAGSLAGIREGAATVRGALKALEDGDEPKAVARLAGVGRSSPFADWKYFVRGLAAYYRQDSAEMLANWDRLDPARFAARIASPLRALADPTSANRSDPLVKRGLGKIAAEVLGGPVLTHLYDLRTHLAADRWKNVLESLRKCYPLLRSLDPAIAAEIVEFLYPTILHKGMEARLADLAAAVDPLPTDPHWNRAKALLCEQSPKATAEEAEPHWLRYLDDLAGMECLSPADRTLAQALVWEWLAEHYVVNSHSVRGWGRRSDDLAARLKARAVECFENSLRLAPSLLSAYQSLASAQVRWNESDRAADTHRRLLEQFPENVDSLLFLAGHYALKDEPIQARDYALRAYELKPANKTVVNLLWTAHVGSARHYALRKEWEKGRAAFEAADRLKPSDRDLYYLLARKAMFELKARSFELGEELVERAKSQAGEPAVALLGLAIESIRYDLSKTARTSFDRQWRGSLRKRCRSRTAGLMCRMMAGYLKGKVDYPGRSAHVGRLLAYVRRCSRVRWDADDLRAVCDFVETAHEVDETLDEKPLFAALVRKGLRKFPQDPAFLVRTGELEILRGPFSCNRTFAHDCFARALDAAKGCDDPETAALVERGKHHLTFLEDAGLEPPHGPGDYGDDYDYDEDYGDEDVQDEFDGDDFDDSPFAVPGPAGPFSSDLDVSDDLSPDEMLRIFIEACDKFGLDPEEALDELGGELPIRLRPPTRQSRDKSRNPSRHKSRNKRKKKRRSR